MTTLIAHCKRIEISVTLVLNQYALAVNYFVESFLLLKVARAIKLPNNVVDAAVIPLASDVFGFFLSFELFFASFEFA